LHYQLDIEGKHISSLLSNWQN